MPETGERRGNCSPAVVEAGFSRGVERPLKRRQARILAFIQDFTSCHFYSPSVREITDGCGISSTSVTDYNLRVLSVRGYLSREPGIARGMALTELGRAWPLVPPDSAAGEAV